MSNSKPVVAYQVDRNDGEGSVVIFSTHGLEARRKGAYRLECEFEDCTSHRVKQFDQYADKGFVPIKALLEDGWWVYSAFDYSKLEESASCASEIEYDDYYDTLYLPEWLVFSPDERSVWKTWEEMERHAYSINEALDRKAWFIEAVKAAYPQFSFCDFTGGPGYITHTASFEFPGSRYKGNVYWDWDENKQPSAQDFRCYVCQGDQEALDKYLQSLL